MRRRLLISLVTALATGPAFASHIAGGYMGYTCLGQGNFTVWMYLYRDCGGGGPQLPNNATIAVYNANDSLIATITASQMYLKELEIKTYGNPCLSPPSSLCVEEGYYQANITLPPSVGGYVFVYQVCCRNASIINITDPDDEGATYWAKVPDPDIGCNSAPFFGEVPPLAICKNDTLMFDHSAYDQDGDSLVYYLCTAMTGPLNPNPPNPPPYNPVPYASGYSAQYPLGSSTWLTIDSLTGFLTGYPTTTGRHVVAICVDEYRNGQKIGEYHRDVEFEVVTCTVNVNAQILGSAGIGTPIYACGSYTVNFKNASTGAPLFWWDFGTGSPADTSIAVNPSFTYTDTGTYTITLIANKTWPCADTTTATLHLYPGLSNAFTWSTPTCQGVPIQFTNQSSVQFGSIVSYGWVFPGGNPSSSNQPNPTVTFPTAGLKNVQLSIISSLGCKDTVSQPVLISPTPALSVTPSTTICVGESLQLSTTGTGAFDWTPLSSGLSCYDCPSPIATPSANTTYTVVLTSAAGCTNQRTVTVNLSDYPVVNAGNDVLICGTGTTQFSATASDTSGAVAWHWTPSGLVNDSVISNPIANPPTGVTTFCVTATNQYGCATTDCLDVQRNVLSVNAGADQSYCYGGNAQLSASSPNSPVTWSWAPNTGLNPPAPTINNPVASPTTTTVYTVTITDPDNCTISDSVTITVLDLPPIDAGPNTSVCPGYPTQLTATGAASYTWQPGGDTTATITVAPSSATTYTVTGVGANGCEASDVVTVLVQTEPLVTITPDTFFCAGTGGVQLNVQGPVGSTYQWTPAPGINPPYTIPNPNVNPSGNQTYLVKVTDPNGCYMDTSVTVTVRPNPTITASGPPAPICSGVTTSVTANGAGPGGTYLWTPGGIPGTSANVAPPSTTTYTVVGTDTWGCSGVATVTVNVTQLPIVTAIATPPVICIGDNSVLVASGASSYVWQPGNIPGSGINVTPGSVGIHTYTVTGTASGCIADTQVTVTVNDLPNVTASTPTPDICAGASATLNAGGANTYAWQPGGMVGPSVPVSPSVNTIYTVTGTDANGCKDTATVAVNVHVLPVITGSATPQDICIGDSATLNASGAGVGGGYQWQPMNQSGKSIPVTPPAAGGYIYTVTGTDTWGCSGSGQVSLTVHDLPNVTATALNSNICINDGTTLNASGASTYLWQPGSFAGPSYPVTPGSAGNHTYTVTGTDTWGCENDAQITVTVNDLPTVTATASPTDVCAGQSSTLTAAGAVTYTWSHGLPSTNPVNAIPSSITTYTVTGTDANGCSSNGTVTVTAHPIPTITITNSKPDLCVGDSSVLSGTGAGAGGDYLWQPGNLNTSNITVNPTATTSYTVTGTDSWGCQSTATSTVTVHQPPLVSVGPDQSVCEGGSIIINATGAQSYVWQPGGHTGSSLTITPLGLDDTTFTVTGTDQWGCVNTDDITITVDPLPTITVDPVAPICAGVSATLMAYGGATYDWVPGGSGNPITVAPSSTTTYVVTGTDAKGCQNTATVTVDVMDLPTVKAGLDAAICIGESTQLSASGAVTYSWTGPGIIDPTVPDPIVTPTVTSTYQLTGTDVNGCSNTDQVTVTVNPLPVITASPDVIIYQGECATLSASGAVSYLWEPSIHLNDLVSDRPVACPIDTGTYIYMVTGTDINGCIGTDVTVLRVVGIPMAVLPSAFTPNNDGLNDVFRIEKWDNFDLVQLSIYDRWGNLIFKSSDIAAGWNGKSSGRDMPIGSYVYMVTGVDHKGASVIRQGNVTLLR